MDFKTFYFVESMLHLQLLLNTTTNKC